MSVFICLCLKCMYTNPRSIYLIQRIGKKKKRYCSETEACNAVISVIQICFALVQLGHLVVTEIRLLVQYFVACRLKDDGVEDWVAM